MSKKTIFLIEIGDKNVREEYYIITLPKIRREKGENTMKKLGAVLMSALCLTVGGVYATWVYAQGGAAVGDRTVDVGLAGSSNATAKGSIAVIGRGLSLTIDDTDDSVSHNAVLVIDGQMDVTFAPAAGANTDVIATGIPMVYTLSVINSGTYTDANGQVVNRGTYLGEQIITVDTGTYDLNGGVACLTTSISAAELSSHIHLADDIVLDTQDDYDMFQKALLGCQIKVTVSEKTGA